MLLQRTATLHAWRQGLILLGVWGGHSWHSVPVEMPQTDSFTMSPAQHAPQRNERGQRHRHLLGDRNGQQQRRACPNQIIATARRVTVTRSTTRRAESIPPLFSLEAQSQSVIDKCGDSSWHGVSACAITANIDCSTGRVPYIVFLFIILRQVI